MRDTSEGSSATLPHEGPSRPYRVAFALAVLVAVVAVVFFVVGIADGSVSSFNIALWLGLLTGIAAILVLGRQLRAHGHPKLALALLSILALPGLMYAFFMLLVVASGTRWN